MKEYENFISMASQILAHMELTVDDLPTRMLDDRLGEDPPVRTPEELLLAHFKEDSLSSIRTVRFLSDFPRYRAGVDWNTKNTSFKRTAEIYRLLGVKNFYFCLQLNNPLLSGVDPRDPKLTDETKLMIMHEARTNIWYFLREVCHLSDGRYFRANRANISFIWCWLNHINQLLILPRQVGKTVSVQVITFWLLYLAGKSYETGLVTLKDKNRAQFIDAIKGIRSNTPPWMINVTYRDKDAGSGLTYGGWGREKLNKLVVEVPQIGQEDAKKVGRGGTYKTRFYDEPAYIKWIEEIINAAGPSTLTARANAREAKEPYGTGYITTPASYNTDSGKYMFDLLMSSTEWREKFFDSFSESHLYARLIKASPKETLIPSISMVYNYLQLGKDKDWPRRTKDELHMSDSEVKIDLLLMWGEDGKGKLFDDATRDAINDSKKEIKWSQEIKGTGLFIDWFISQDEHRKILEGNRNTFYLVGSDTSGAVNQDACTIVIRDARTGTVVGVGRYALAFLMDVGEVIKTILLEIENSMLIIERNYAPHMIDQLLISLPALGIDPFKRIYNQIYQDPVKFEKEFREVKQRTFSNRTPDFYLRYKQYFGFNTTRTTREQLYSFIQEAVGMTGNGINYAKLADELINLKVKSDRIDHEGGKHDDLVIAWLLTYWFIKLGNNKSEYNIPPGICLSDVSVMSFAGKEVAKIDPHEEARINYYRNKITQMTDRLILTTDPYVAIRLELELEKLTSQVPNELVKNMTIDQIVKDAKEARVKAMMEKRKKNYR